MTTPTESSEPQQPAPGAPGDVPAARPAALERLDALIGAWDMEATFEAGYFAPGAPAFTARGGRTVFEWLAGQFFLLQHFTAGNPAAPSGLAVIGAAADGAGTFTQHYYDSRGVARVYQMSLAAGVWKVWRDAPGFWQRYTGVISADGTSITGAWEYSPDGVDWSHDFTLTYLAAAQPAPPPNNQNR